MRRAVVFAGPSLRPPRSTLAAVDYRAPAARGDLLRAVQQGASIIGLVDGVFSQSLAVTPAEIREAAAIGAQIYGGASMGALRACECPDVMEGLGRIYKAFVDKTLSDDDEVAVTYLPDTYELVTYPLVQIRETARLALDRYSHAQSELAQFVESVRTHPFHHRTLDLIRRSADAAISAGIPWDELEQWLTDPRYDIKRDDAMAVVQRAQDALGTALNG